MKRSKTLSIVLLCLCVAALIGLSIISYFSSAKLDQLMSTDLDGADDVLPGASLVFVMVTCLGLVWLSFVEIFIVALCGCIAAIAGIKVAANRIFKAIFIGLTVYFSIAVLFVGGILFITILM